MGILGKIFSFGNKRPRRFCYAVGLYTIGYGIYDMTYYSIAHNAREMINHKSRYGEGSWVVISGATDALGEEFANKFSAKGFNVVLVDQDGEHLKSV